MQHRLPHHSVYYIRPSQNGIASYTPINLYFWSLANVNERNVHGSIITACYRSNVIVKRFSYCCVISLLIISNSFELRTEDKHRKQCQNLDGPAASHYSKTYGINRKTSLLDIRYFFNSNKMKMRMTS